MDGQELVDQRPSELREHVIERVVCEYAARERIAVGVQSVGRQHDDGVPGCDAIDVDQRGFRGHADHASGKVELVFLIDPRKLGGLAAEQRAVELPAGPGRALDDIGDDFGVEPGGGEIVEKRARQRTDDKYVVCAVIHDVGADGVVAPGLGRDGDLGSDRIDAGDDDGIIDTRRNPQRAPKSADIAHDERAVS